ncbi:TPA: hypothetical protein DCW54_01590, partial [Candidatus Dependentiae bacterium]|nr:hypothetical protein [Candidatus Dependentiae bacterium]
AKEYLLNNLPNKKAQQTPQPDRLTKDRTQYFLVAKDKLKMFDMSPMCLDCWVELCAHYSNAVNSWDPEQQGKTEVDDQKIDANINKYRSQG